MTMTVAHIHRFPVKGLTAQPLTSVTLSPGAGLPVDRLYAFTHGKSQFNATRPTPLPKTNYLMLMRNAKMAKLHATYSDDGLTIHLSEGERHMVTGRLDDPQTALRLETAVHTFMGGEAFGAAQLVQAPDQILADVGEPAISLISLSTVRAIAEAWGTDVDPQRFRGNLLIEGAAPWTEFDWIGQNIQIGPALLHITKRTERCAATTVNPTTAERDLQVPKKLMQSFGHLDCGVYAKVITGGPVAVGDPIIVAGQDQ